MKACLPFRHRWHELADYDYTSGKSVLLGRYMVCSRCHARRSLDGWRRFKPLRTITIGELLPWGYGVWRPLLVQNRVAIAWWGLNWLLAAGRWFYLAVAMPGTMINSAAAASENKLLRRRVAELESKLRVAAGVKAAQEGIGR